MARWRAPPEHSTALITRDGLERLKAELDDLWRRQRPEVVQALAAAAAEGDRSENAEYTYRKRQLAQIDRRVRYLGKRLPALKVVEHGAGAPDGIYFGAWIELRRHGHNRHLHYRIVGPDETDAGLGWISIDSPLARAALRRGPGDAFEAPLPDGPAAFTVVAVRYRTTD
jgi:transcription elongation factor GreB